MERDFVPVCSSELCQWEQRAAAAAFWREQITSEDRKDGDYCII